MLHPSNHPIGLSPAYRTGSGGGGLNLLSERNCHMGSLFRNCDSYFSTLHCCFLANCGPAGISMDWTFPVKFTPCFTRLRHFFSVGDFARITFIFHFGWGAATVCPAIGRDIAIDYSSTIRRALKSSRASTSDTWPKFQTCEFCKHQRL